VSFIDYFEIYVPMMVSVDGFKIYVPLMSFVDFNIKLQMTSFANVSNEHILEPMNTKMFNRTKA
jgi:hypothetical protein